MPWAIWGRMASRVITAGAVCAKEKQGAAMATPPNTVVELKKRRRSIEVLQRVKDGPIVVNHHVRIMTPLQRSGAQLAQLVRPLLHARVTQLVHHADQGLVDRGNTDKAQYVAFQILDAVGPKVPAVQQGWHAHGDHHPGG